MFQLSDHEFSIIRSQIVTASKRNRRFLPYAFTEHGVAILSSVLRSEVAVEINIQIIQAFVRLRKLIESHAVLAQKLEHLEQKYDTQFRVVFDAIRKLMSETTIPPKRQIGFERDKEP